MELSDSRFGKWSHWKTLHCQVQVQTARLLNKRRITYLTPSRTLLAIRQELHAPIFLKFSKFQSFFATITAYPSLVLDTAVLEKTRRKLWMKLNLISIRDIYADSNLKPSTKSSSSSNSSHINGIILWNIFDVRKFIRSPSYTVISLSRKPNTLS